MTDEKQRQIRLYGALALLAIVAAVAAWRFLGTSGGNDAAAQKAAQKAEQLSQEAAKQPGFVKTMPDPVEKPPPGKNRAPTTAPSK